MSRPSGDHTGLRSCAPDDCVRLRGWPFSAGTVKISPRASKAARTRRGERRVANHARNFLELRASPRQISGHFDIEFLRLTRFRIDEIDVAGLFVNDCVGAADAVMTSKSS
jgi:hypothetical protein